MNAPVLYTFYPLFKKAGVWGKFMNGHIQLFPAINENHPSLFNDKYYARGSGQYHQYP
jgi:hypothetical protein